MFELKGIYAPIPSPFDDADGIAYDRLAENMAFWEKSRLSGIVVMGSNGEFVLLSPRERREIIDEVCRMAKKPVIAGTGCETTRETIELCEYAARAGAKAALVLSPNYYKRAMSEKTLAVFYRDVADASPIPVILYNMPANSGVNLSSSLVSALSSHENIIGVKDSGGNIVQMSEIIRDTGEDFAMFAGSASFLYATTALGGKGGTLALANILPDECAELFDLTVAGKHREAAALQLKLLAANAAVTARWGIAGLKAAMEIVGLYGGLPRRPLMPLSMEDYAALEAIIAKARA